MSDPEKEAFYRLQRIELEGRQAYIAGAAYLDPYVNAGRAESNAWSAGYNAAKRAVQTGGQALG